MLRAALRLPGGTGGAVGRMQWSAVNNCRSYADKCDDDAPVSMENPFEREKKVCVLCRLKIAPDYKNVRLLSQFQSRFTGRIYGRNITGLCEKRQDQLEKSVLLAQNAGLMSYYSKDLKFVDDPKLYDPERPLRPHPY